MGRYYRSRYNKYYSHRCNRDGLDIFFPPIPLATGKAIVFPYNFRKGRFISDHYSPDMTDDQVSKDELARYLSYVEEQMEEWRIAQQPLGIVWILISVLISATLLFIPFVVLALRKRAQKATHLFNSMYLKIQNYTSDKNTNIYKPYGLSWDVLDGFPMYIRLRKGNLTPVPSSLLNPANVVPKKYGNRSISPEPLPQPKIRILPLIANEVYDTQTPINKSTNDVSYSQDENDNSMAQMVPTDTVAQNL